MSDDELYGPGRLRTFSPYLAPDQRRQLRDAFQTAESPRSFVEDLRALARRYIDDGDSLKLRAILLLVADLYEQGWQVAVTGKDILVQPPGIDRGEETIEQVKERVRQGLQLGRLRQLQEPSVRQFLARVERRVPRNGIKASVLNLVDDGRDLAAELARINSVPAEERCAALASLIDPVIEVCDAGVRCSDTGLPLTDIWRYFRHTWAHEYRPIPGRQLLLLIRNAARPNRPVMGLAMLASPVMRLTSRDRWIGWLRGAAEDRLATGAWDRARFGAALTDRVEASIAGVRWDDLATATEIARPNETAILRLEQRAAGAA